MNEIINVIIAKADTVVKQSALILGKPDVPELIAAAQDVFAQAQKEKSDEQSSGHDDADADNYTIINDKEIICNQCGSLQPIRRIKGVCWKCGIRFSGEQGEAVN